MPIYLKQLRVPLYDLAANFHGLMIEENASHFTADKFGNTPFYYITDLREDGTYPCHPTDSKGNTYYPKYIDYKETVTIHFN